MKTFRCACGARIFFENTTCTACGRELGFAAELSALTAIEPTPDGGYLATLDGHACRKCSNYVEQGVCNWLVPAEDGHSLCQACRLNRVVPDLSQPESRQLWAAMETAKRRLLYTLNQLKLPALPVSESPHGLTFDIKADTPGQRVLTGHADGVITLNVAEADPVLREQVRVEMDERYRTPLGHLRHESGHYYWELLIGGTPRLERFRALFGDERADYGAALRAHYAHPRRDWQSAYISHYASAHPMEDWAETWAHYLHLIDTLETAAHFGFVPDGEVPAPLEPADMGALMDTWSELTIALNSLNRSMGMPDPYPFQAPPPVVDKLDFVHGVLIEAGGEGGARESGAA